MGPSHPATHGVLRLVLQARRRARRRLRAAPRLPAPRHGEDRREPHLPAVHPLHRPDGLPQPAGGQRRLRAGRRGAARRRGAAALRGRSACICCELARIGSHLLWLGTHALDLGAATVFFHTFKDREWHYDLIEDLCGARLTTSYTRVGGVMHDVDAGVAGQAARVRRRDARPHRRVRVAADREHDLARSAPRAWARSAPRTPIALRHDRARRCAPPASSYDLRKARPYSGYENYDFEIPVGTEGDIYDRYLVRIEEMRQSVPHPRPGAAQPARRAGQHRRPEDLPPAEEAGADQAWKS